MSILILKLLAATIPAIILYFFNIEFNYKTKLSKLNTSIICVLFIITIAVNHFITGNDLLDSPVGISIYLCFIYMLF